MNKVYVIGTEPIPEWCKAEITPYIKTDGSTGYEYWGRLITFELSAGDELHYDGFKITAKRKKVVHDGESKRVSSASEEAGHDDSQRYGRESPVGIGGAGNRFPTDGGQGADNEKPT